MKLLAREEGGCVKTLNRIFVSITKGYRSGDLDTRRIYLLQRIKNELDKYISYLSRTQPESFFVSISDLRPQVEFSQMTPKKWSQWVSVGRCRKCVTQEGKTEWDPQVSLRAAGGSLPNRSAAKPVPKGTRKIAAADPSPASQSRPNWDRVPRMGSRVAQRKHRLN